MASFPTQRLEEESLRHGRAEVQSNACLTTPPRGPSAHLWVGEQQIPVAENRLCSNVFVPCLLPQLLAYSALQKATGGWWDGAEPLVPI